MQPKFEVNVGSNAALSSGWFYRCLHRALSSAAAMVLLRERLFASVEAMLVRRSLYYRGDYLVFILKEGVGPVDTREARKGRLDSFGLKDMHTHTILACYGAGGDVRNFMDVYGENGPFASIEMNRKKEKRRARVGAM